MAELLGFPAKRQVPAQRLAFPQPARTMGRLPRGRAPVALGSAWLVTGGWWLGDRENRYIGGGRRFLWGGCRFLWHLRRFLWRGYGFLSLRCRLDMARGLGSHSARVSCLLAWAGSDRLVSGCRDAAAEREPYD